MKGIIKKIATVFMMVTLVMVSVIPFTLEEVDAATLQNITRVSGKDSFQTSIAVADALKAELKISKFDNIIISTSKTYPDALAGSSLAAMINAPIILVADNNLSDTVKYVNSNLKENGTVYILGGKSAVSASFESAFELNYQVIRLGGKNALDTNLLILQETFYFLPYLYI